MKGGEILNNDVIVSLISNVSTIGVGILTAVVAYKGSLRGAKEQIEHERKKLRDEAAEQRQFANLAIQKFLSYEIKKNFLVICTSRLSNSINILDEPFQFGLHPSFTYTEFNNLKYDLIKYNSEEIEEIINIYEMFYLIELKGDIISLTQDEYTRFRKAYKTCLMKYGD
jgi:hypothetical protein